MKPEDEKFGDNTQRFVQNKVCACMTHNGSLKHFFGGIGNGRGGGGGRGRQFSQCTASKQARYKRVLFIAAVVGCQTLQRGNRH